MPLRAAIASTSAVDATITQGSVSKTFRNYRFSQFSPWTSIFHGGTGTIEVREHGSGTALLTATIPLTPGPLVIVIKGAWPPTKPTAVEAIAASFTPPKTGSAVRLFNLALDVPFAKLLDGAGKPLADQVQYSLGSPWVPVPAGQQTFTAVADGGTARATAPFSPPNAPEVFSVFLLGDKSFGYSLVPQVDAPETGPCKPPARACDT